MKRIQHFILVKSVGLYVNILSFVRPEKAKKLAYQLFSQPRKGRIDSTKLPKTLVNTEKETFSFQNETFQTYMWRGNEEIILLIHGWESNSSRWKKLLPYLLPLGKTIIAIDAPAHGLSSGKEFSAPKYAEYINVVTQKYQAKLLIGHSIGGGAIACYLNKYNDLSVQKVILLGSPSDFKLLNNNYVALLSLNAKVKILLEKHIQEKFNIHLDDFKGHLFAENFSQKALIAHDIDDKIVLVEEGKKYASTWKNATYIETKGLGHSLHGKDLYKTITDFIKL